MSRGVFDLESRSTVALEVAGAWRYAGDLSTEILCSAYAIDDGPAQIWRPGDPPPQDLLACDEIVAHNWGFERPMSARILTPRYGWPEIPLAKQRCSMALALANALPAALEKTAKALGLPFEKDKEGYRLMRQMSRPRRPRKGEDPNGIYWVDGPDLRKRLELYCCRDVEVERAIYRRLPPLSPEEQFVWELDAIINARGFFVDKPLTIAARDVARTEQAAVQAEVAALTNGEIVSIHQVEKIKEFVRAHGHALETLTRRSVSQVLRHNPSDAVRQLLELRRAGARASTKKFDALLASIDADSRLRGTLRFHGSSTGRWSGSRFQPQNLKKPETKDLDSAIAAILAGDMAKVRELGAPLTIAGDISRAVICAKPGHKLVGGDFSAIESRILACVAGENWKLEAYRKHDETSDPKFEPYCVMASKALKREVTPEDEAGRAFGKVFDLAFGFGGGLGAWRRFDDSDTYSDFEVEQFKTEFRYMHPETTRFWHHLERAAHQAVITGRRINLKNQFSFEMQSGTLLLTLPSGRRLSYPEAKLVPGKFEGTYQLRYKDNAQGKWSDIDAWYGTLVENVVQATARDIMAAAMQRLEAAGYPIILTVHDEIVCEVPEEFGSVEEFQRLLVELPAWARGLPIAAKARSGPRYAKTSTATIAPTQAAQVESLTMEVPEVPRETNKRTSALPQGSQSEHNLVEDENGTAHAEEPVAADADEDNELSEALATVPLPDLVSENLTNNLMCCPFHADNTPSLHIYPDHYFCFSCGTHGNQLDWLVAVEGMKHAEAVEMLKNWDGPLIDHAAKSNKAEANRSRALRLWGEAVPLTNTLGARYLSEIRGIDLAQLPADIDTTLRFHRYCPFNGVHHPCLLAMMRDILTDEPTGIHRIALTPDARKIDRWMLGNAGAVKLWPASSQLVIGEGIETVLAAATRIPYEDAPLRPAWALTSSGPITQFPVLKDVERLVLLVDHDSAGIAAAKACTQRWARARRTVVQLLPDEAGADFNDLIMPGKAS
jgi:DNA polymerase family A/CHC2 zinc finger/Toprim domain